MLKRLAPRLDWAPPLLEFTDAERDRAARILREAAGRELDGPGRAPQPQRQRPAPPAAVADGTVRRTDEAAARAPTRRCPSASPAPRRARRRSSRSCGRSTRRACSRLAGRTTLRELFAVYDACDVLLTNDSGPGHFSSLTDIHTIVLFGPETPALYGPLGRNAHVLYTGLACSPCVNALNHRFSPCQNNVCMQIDHGRAGAGEGDVAAGPAEPPPADAGGVSATRISNGFAAQLIGAGRPSKRLGACGSSRRKPGGHRLRASVDGAQQHVGARRPVPRRARASPRGSSSSSHSPQVHRRHRRTAPAPRQAPAVRPAAFNRSQTRAPPAARVVGACVSATKCARYIAPPTARRSATSRRAHRPSRPASRQEHPRCRDHRGMHSTVSGSSANRPYSPGLPAASATNCTDDDRRRHDAAARARASARRRIAPSASIDAQRAAHARRQHRDRREPRRRPRRSA